MSAAYQPTRARASRVLCLPPALEQRAAGTVSAAILSAGTPGRVVFSLAGGQLPRRKKLFVPTAQIGTDNVAATPSISPRA
jgi:hypothetical protein